MTSGDTLSIVPVAGRLALQRFIRLPHRIYRGDRHWIPPLDNEVLKLLSPRHNPFFEHGEMALWLAYRGGEPVGRISAQINRLHLEIHKENTGNFGFLEAIDDQAVFHALLGAAEDWLRARGMTRVLGPYSPTINDEIGVLVSGFDMAPMVMMGHSPAYYARRLEGEGYRKAKDVHAYLMELDRVDRKDIERVERATARLRSEGRLQVRTVDISRFDEEMRLILDIYNDAWADNWGFLPVTAREAELLIASIKPVLDPRGVIIGTVDGQAVSMAVSLPNINEFIADLGGRLMPFNWIKLLWRLKHRPPRSVRVILAGVRKVYRDSALSGALITLMLAELERYLGQTSVERVELSWILEDNKASLAVQRVGARLSKIYRIYGKTLG